MKKLIVTIRNITALMLAAALLAGILGWTSLSSAENPPEVTDVTQETTGEVYAQETPELSPVTDGPQIGSDLPQSIEASEDPADSTSDNDPQENAPEAEPPQSPQPQVKEQDNTDVPDDTQKAETGEAGENTDPVDNAAGGARTLAEEDNPAAENIEETTQEESENNELNDEGSVEEYAADEEIIVTVSDPVSSYTADNSYLSLMTEEDKARVKYAGNYGILYGDTKITAFSLHEAAAVPGDDYIPADEVYEEILNEETGEPETVRAQTETLSANVYSCLYYGYPYNNGNFYDKAVNVYGIATENAADAVRIATQMAVWYISDSDTGILDYGSNENYMSDLTDTVFDLAGEIAYLATVQPVESNGSVQLYYSAANGSYLIVTDNEDVTIPLPSIIYSGSGSGGNSNYLTIATKVLEGKQLQEGQFTFKVYHGNEYLGETSNDAQGNIKFTIPYESAGIYEYTIMEVNDNQPGITYDEESVKTVKIAVEQGGIVSQTVNTDLYYGVGYNGNDFYMIPVGGGESIKVYCIDISRKAPPSSASDSLYWEAELNPSDAMLKACANDTYTVVSGYQFYAYDGWNDSLTANLSKALYYFDYMNNTLSTGNKQNLVWYMTSGQRGCPSGNKSMINWIKTNVSVPEGYTLVLFHPSNSTYQTFAALLPASSTLLPKAVPVIFTNKYTTPGYEMPDTGGKGDTAYRISGSALILTAAVTAAGKRKKRALTDRRNQPDAK